MMLSVFKPGLSYNVTTSTTVSAATSNNVTAGIKVVRLVSTTACWVVVGVSPTANKTTSVYLTATTPEYFRCAWNGEEKVAVIADTVAGTLNVTEMTQ